MCTAQYSLAFTFVVDAETDRLTGINGLIVGDSIYNATFVEGKAEDIFYDGTNWNFDFTDGVLARQATEALRAAIESEANYDYYPSMYIYGLAGNTNLTRMMTPYMHQQGSPFESVYSSMFENQHNISYWEEYDMVSGYSVYINEDSAGMLQGYFPWVFVRWEAQGPAVPVPGAIWLLGSGLLGFAGIRRSCKI